MWLPVVPPGYNDPPCPCQDGEECLTHERYMEQEPEPTDDPTNEWDIVGYLPEIDVDAPIPYSLIA